MLPVGPVFLKSRQLCVIGQHSAHARPMPVIQRALGPVNVGVLQHPQEIAVQTIVTDFFGTTDVVGVDRLNPQTGISAWFTISSIRKTSDPDSAVCDLEQMPTSAP